jgi:hypothetical protein
VAYLAWLMAESLPGQHWPVVGEAGPEAVIPLSRMGQMGNVTININANVADERLGDVIVNALRQYNRRSGPVNIAVA